MEQQLDPSMEIIDIKKLYWFGFVGRLLGQQPIGEKRQYKDGHVEYFDNIDLEEEARQIAKTIQDAYMDSVLDSNTRATRIETKAETTKQFLDAIKQIDPRFVEKAFDAGVLAVNEIVAAQDAIKAAEEKMQASQERLHAAQLLGFKTI